MQCMRRFGIFELRIAKEFERNREMIINRLKKWLIVCAAAVMANEARGNEWDYEWYYYGDGGAIITKYLGYDSYVSIPSEIQGYSIIELDLMRLNIVISLAM